MQNEKYYQKLSNNFTSQEKKIISTVFSLPSRNKKIMGRAKTIVFQDDEWYCENEEKWRKKSSRWCGKNKGGKLQKKFFICALKFYYLKSYSICITPRRSVEFNRWKLHNSSENECKQVNELFPVNYTSDFKSFSFFNFVAWMNGRVQVHTTESGDTQ